MLTARDRKREGRFRGILIGEREERRRSERNVGRGEMVVSSARLTAECVRLV